MSCSWVQDEDGGSNVCSMDEEVVLSPRPLRNMSATKMKGFTRGKKMRGLKSIQNLLEEVDSMKAKRKLSYKKDLFPPREQ